MPPPTINHRKVSSLPDDPTSDMSSGEWNDSLVVRGDGTLGQIFQRDPAAADGWSLTSTPTMASGSFSTSVSVGSAPASVGAVRLSTNTGIYERNNGNTGDVSLISLNTSDQLIVGWRGGAANPTDAGFLIGPSFNSLGVSGSATPNWTWTVINSGHFLPQNDTAYDIGTPTKRVRAAYAQTVVVGTVEATLIRFEGSTAAHPALRRNGAELQAILGDVSDYATVRAKTYLATTSIQITSSSGFLSIGSPTASAGAIRLPYVGYVYVRNEANTADVIILGHYQDTVFIGSSGAPYLVPGSGDATGTLGKPTNRWVTAHLYYLALADPFGAAPSAAAGQARIFVDGADGDLKVIFGDGVIKTIVLDS